MKTQQLSFVQDPDGNDVLSIVYEKIAKTLNLNISALRELHGRNAELHGWKQRFGDLKAGDDTGHEKFAEVQRLYDWLKDGGDWAMTAQRDTTAIVIEAMNRLDPKKYPVELLTQAAEAKPEQVKDWRANVHVKGMIAKIYAEKAAKVAKEAPKDEIKIDLK